MAELSVFVDESGDFGEVSPHSPYHIVRLMLHEQSSPVDEQVERFRRRVRAERLEGLLPVHTAPLIRREKPYENQGGATRHHVFDMLFAFARRCEIHHKCLLKISASSAAATTSRSASPGGWERSCTRT